MYHKIEHGIFINKIAKNIKYLVIIIVFILLLGLVLSIYWDKTAFARSGALLVIYTIFLVYMNHYIVQDISQTIHMKNSLHEFLSRNSLGQENQREEEAVRLTLKKFKEDLDENEPKLKSINENIVKI